MTIFYLTCCKTCKMHFHKKQENHDLLFVQTQNWKHNIPFDLLQPNTGPRAKNKPNEKNKTLNL